MQLDRLAKTMIVLVSIMLILIYAKTVLIPIVLSILIWLIMRELRRFLSVYAKADRLPRWVQNLMSFILVFFVLSLISRVLGNNIQQITEVFPQYETNLNKVVDDLGGKLNIDIKEYIQNFNFEKILSSILSSITGILGKAFIILVYVIFLLMEEASFRSKLHIMYPEETRYNEVMVIVEKIYGSISSYISLKTLSSGMTGILSYFVLLALGIDFPVLWATLIFLFNYIPTIGSLIATAFPTLIAMLQFGELMPGIYVLIGIGAIQLLIGNFIEPRLMGNSLNISPLVVIISLSVFGFLWGVIGMFLCVPITVILIILFANFPSTRNIAILLSSKGKV